MLCPQCKKPCQHIYDTTITISYMNKPHNAKIILVTCQNPNCPLYNKLLKKEIKIDCNQKL